MYVTRVVLDRIRCFEHIVLDFGPEGQKKWTMLVGNNGEGKSTILRSIAMGLCDETSAAGLFRELRGNLIREGSEKKGGTIRIEVVHEKCHYATETKITELADFEYMEQKYFKRTKRRWQTIRPADFPWDEVFICGYGAARSEEGTEDYDDDPFRVLNQPA